MNTVLHNNLNITPSLPDLLRYPVSTHVNTIIAQDERIQSTMNIASCNNHVPVSCNNQMVTPSFTYLLQNSVRIDAHTTIRQDGRLQSYCGLRLTETTTDYAGINPLPLPDSARLRTTDIAGPSTSKYASTRLPRRSAGPTHLRKAKKGAKKAAFTSTGRHAAEICPVVFFDTQNEVNNRTSAFIDKETSEGIDKDIIGNLISMLDRYSPVAQSFRMARDWCNTHNSPDFRLRLHSERKTTRQYNSPTVSEVAAIIINDFEDAHPTRDIVVERKDTGPQRVSQLHPSYMALQYPLLFPYGEDGFHEKIPYHSNAGTRKTKQGYNFKSVVLAQPHILLLWLEEHSKCKTPDEADDIISAEMPSPESDPDGYKVVTDYMLHGPCGKDARNAACTSDGKCSKHFPKPFLAEMFLD
ncbi:hypothetical protein Tco_0072934 [Tanacetum coccineum]